MSSSPCGLSTAAAGPGESQLTRTSSTQIPVRDECFSVRAPGRSSQCNIAQGPELCGFGSQVSSIGSAEEPASPGQRMHLDEMPYPYPHVSEDLGNVGQFPTDPQILHQVHPEIFDDALEEAMSTYGSSRTTISATLRDGPIFRPPSDPPIVVAGDDDSEPKLSHLKHPSMAEGPLFPLDSSWPTDDDTLSDYTVIGRPDPDAEMTINESPLAEDRLASATCGASEIRKSRDIHHDVAMIDEEDFSRSLSANTSEQRLLPPRGFVLDGNSRYSTKPGSYEEQYSWQQRAERTSPCHRKIGLGLKRAVEHALTYNEMKWETWALPVRCTKLRNMTKRLHSRVGNHVDVTRPDSLQEIRFEIMKAGSDRDATTHPEEDLDQGAVVDSYGRKRGEDTFIVRATFTDRRGHEAQEEVCTLWRQFFPDDLRLPGTEVVWKVAETEEKIVEGTQVTVEANIGAKIESAVTQSMSVLHPSIDSKFWTSNGGKPRKVREAQIRLLRGTEEAVSEHNQGERLPKWTMDNVEFSCCEVDPSKPTSGPKTKRPLARFLAKATLLSNSLMVLHTTTFTLNERDIQGRSRPAESSRRDKDIRPRYKSLLKKS